MRETGSGLRIGRVKDRGEERPSGGPDRANVHGAIQNDGRPPPIIRLTGRSSYTPISVHRQISHEFSLSLLPSSTRPRRFFARYDSDAETTVSRAVQACTGVGFMFAELVGNSCRLTYSYCPARCDSPRRLRRVYYTPRSLPSATGGFTALRALSGTIFRAPLGERSRE